MDSDSAVIVERISARIDKMRQDVQAWSLPLKENAGGQARSTQGSGGDAALRSAVSRLEIENGELKAENERLRAAGETVNDLELENEQLIRRIEKLEKALAEERAKNSSAGTSVVAPAESDGFAELKAAFSKFDEDEDGKITRAEFKRICDSVEALTVPYDWVLSADGNGDEQLDLQEFASPEWSDFLVWAASSTQIGRAKPEEPAPAPEAEVEAEEVDLLAMLGGEDSDDGALNALAMLDGEVNEVPVDFEALKEAFATFDEDKDGKVSRDEFYDLCSRAQGVSVPFEWILDADADGDGYLDFAELSHTPEWAGFLEWVVGKTKAVTSPEAPDVPEANEPAEESEDDLAMLLSLAGEDDEVVEESSVDSLDVDAPPAAAPEVVLRTPAGESDDEGGDALEQLLMAGDSASVSAASVSAASVSAASEGSEESDGLAALLAMAE